MNKRICIKQNWFGEKLISMTTLKKGDRFKLFDPDTHKYPLNNSYEHGRTIYKATDNYKHKLMDHNDGFVICIKIKELS